MSSEAIELQNGCVQQSDVHRSKMDEGLLLLRAFCGSAISNHVLSSILLI